MRGQASPDRPRLLQPHASRMWRSTARSAFAATCAAAASAPFLCCRNLLCPIFVSVSLVISLFLIARLLHGCTLPAAAQAAAQPGMPYQRGQFWVRRFRQASRWLVRGPGSVDRPHGCSQLRHQGLAHVSSRWLDRGAPLPVFRLARPPVGLAALSRSGRASRRAPAGGPIHLTAPTQHLHRARRVSRVSFSHGHQS